MHTNGNLALVKPMRTFRKRIAKKYNLTNLEVFQTLYETTQEDCYVRVFSQTTGDYKAYNINSLQEENKVHNILNAYDPSDLMITFNTYKTMQRATQANLFTIQAIVLDVDYNFVPAWKKHSTEEILGILEQEYFNCDIPTPTFVEYCNNLRLIYVLEEPLYVGVRKGATKEEREKSRATKVLVNRIGQVLAKQLKDFNASSQQIHTYIRPAGSINSRNGEKIQIVQTGEKILFEELQEWLPDLPDWYTNWKKQKQLKAAKKGKKGTQKKVINLHNVNTLNQNRLNDLVTIQKHLNFHGEARGCRHQLCFLYFNCRLQQIKMLQGFNYELGKEDYRDAMDDTLIYNSNFVDPLYERELEGLYRTQRRYGNLYLFTNEKMVELCNISISTLEILNVTFAQERKSSKQRTKDHYEKNKEAVKERKLNRYHENKESINKKRSIGKKEEVLEICKKINVLLAEGHSRKEILELLDLTVDTYKNRLKQLKKYQEQELL